MRNDLLDKLLRPLSRRWDHSQLKVVRDLLDCQVLSTGKRLENPPTNSGDVDVNGQPECMPWSQFQSYLGAFDPTATRLLQQVETNGEDPVVVDNTGMTDVERRLSIQLFYVLALACRGKALQVVRRVPEGFGFETWKQLCREFEPRLPIRFHGMLQALLSPTRMDDPVQTI